MFGFRYPAVIVLCCVAAGTLAGRYGSPGVTILSVLAVGVCAALVFAYVRQLRPYFVLLLALGLFFGAWNRAADRYQTIPPDDVSRLIPAETKVLFFGRVTAWPEIKREKTLLTCRIDSVVVADSIHIVSGQVLVVIRRPTTGYALGDRIRFQGRLMVPRPGGFLGGFDYGRYLENRGIRGVITLADPARVAMADRVENRAARAVAGIRHWIMKTFTADLGPVSAAMATGFLIGETRDIPESLYQAFRCTGTMHLLAVSGSNVALVLAVVLFLLRGVPLGRRARLVVLLGVILLFCNLSNNQPSVARASLVAALVLIARVIYRRVDFNNILGLAAAVLVLYDPGNLFDVGFQLSFAAAWGLVLFLPPINDLFLGSRWPTWARYLLLLFSTSMIASLISTPITLAYFGTASSVTVLSNMIVVPLVSLAVVGIMILLLVALVYPPAAAGPGIILDRLLSLTGEIVLWFSRLEWAELTIPSLSPLHVLYLLAVISCLFAAIRHRPARHAVVFLLLGGAIVQTAVAVVRPGHAPRIEVFNQGLSQTILVDDGPGAVVYRAGHQGRFDDFTDDLLPYLKARKAPVPRYFLFFEPRYQTEERLERWADAGKGVPLVRIAPGPDDSRPALYMIPPGIEAGAEDSAGEIVMAPDGIRITLDDRRQLIFAESTESAVRLAGEEAGLNQYLFLFVDDAIELADIGLDLNAPTTVVLFSPQIKHNKILIDNALEDFSGCFSGWVVEKGERIRLGLDVEDWPTDRNFPVKN